MEYPDFDRAELPDLADYVARWLLGMRDWCSNCHGRGNVADVMAPSDSSRTVRCDRCEGRRWKGAIDLERLLVALSHHRRKLAINVSYSTHGYVVWSAEDADFGEGVQESDPLHAAYRLGAKVIARLEAAGALNRMQPTDYIDH